MVVQVLLTVIFSCQQMSCSPTYIVAVSSFGDVVNAIGGTGVDIATVRKLLVIGVPLTI